MRPLHQIARSALDNLRASYSDKPKPPAFSIHAHQYLIGLLSMQSCADNYGLEYGDMMVARTLSALASWRGPFARAIKVELLEHLDAYNTLGPAYFSLKTQSEPERSEGECLTSLRSGDHQP